MSNPDSSRRDIEERDSNSVEGDANAFRRKLGLSDRKYLDESMAPPVDRDLLGAFNRDELDTTEHEKVLDLIAAFKSWSDVYDELLLEKAEQERKKTEYFSRFALAHLNAFHAHASEFGQQLGRNDGPDDSWRNVAEHCLVAGAFADLLARRLGLPSNEVKQVADAAVLHDWNKKLETKARRSVDRVGKQSDEVAREIRAVVERIKTEGDSLLHQMTKKPVRTEGGTASDTLPRYSSDVIELTAANIPKDALGPQTDKEKILWYVDAMLTDTKPEPIAARFDALENHPRRGPENIAFSEAYAYRDGEESLSLYQLQRRIGDLVGAEFAARLGIENPDELPLKLREMLEEEIMAQS